MNIFLDKIPYSDCNVGTFFKNDNILIIIRIGE